MYNYRIVVNGLECQACSKLAAMDIEDIEGVSNVKIDDKGVGTLLSLRQLTKDEIISYLKSKYKLEEINEIK